MVRGVYAARVGDREQLVLLLVVREIPRVGEQLERAPDRGQRRADLVRYHRHELGLQAVERLGVLEQLRVADRDRGLRGVEGEEALVLRREGARLVETHQHADRLPLGDQRHREHVPEARARDRGHLDPLPGRLGHAPDRALLERRQPDGALGLEEVRGLLRTRGELESVNAGDAALLGLLDAQIEDGGRRARQLGRLGGHGLEPRLELFQTHVQRGFAPSLRLSA